MVAQTEEPLASCRLAESPPNKGAGRRRQVSSEEESAAAATPSPSAFVSKRPKRGSRGDSPSRNAASLKRLALKKSRATEKESPAAVKEAADDVGETLVFECDGVLDSSVPFKDFAALHLDRRLAKVVLNAFTLSHPTHVQRKVIPLALSGRDLVVEAKTGSGKTLAYVLPLLQRLLLSSAGGASGAALPPLSGLILVPSKELCIQVFDVLSLCLKYCAGLITADHSARSDESAFLPPNIFVCTPSGLLRSLRLFETELRLSVELRLSLQALVVDEADLMMAYGFGRDLEQVTKLLPATAARHYQSILVSATQTQDVARLKSLLLHKPLVVRVLDSSRRAGANGAVSEFYLQLPADRDRWLVAYALLKLNLVPLKSLIFAKDVANAYALRIFLDKFGIASGVLTGVLPVASRQQLIHAFNQGLVDILITTDGDWDRDEEWCSSRDSPEGAVASNSLGENSAGKQSEAEAPVNSNEAPSDPSSVTAPGARQKASLKSSAPSKKQVRPLLRALVGGGRGLACLPLVLGAVWRRSRCRLRVTRSSAGTGDLTCKEWLPFSTSTRRRRSKPTFTDTLTPLSLALQDVECFRYRVEDVRRGLTRRVVAASVARDLQQQLLGARRLKEFFERNPRDREVLKRASKQLKERNVSKGHLGHVPEYLLEQSQPTQMTAVQLAIHQQKAQDTRGGLNGRQRRASQQARRIDGSRRERDPLRVFRAVAKTASNPTAKTSGSSRGRFGGKRVLAPSREEQLKKEPSHADTPPEKLPAISGRKLWKLRHHKRVGVKNPKGNFLKKRELKGLKHK